VTFSEAVRAGLAGWDTWSGRSSRPECWWFSVFNLMVLIPVALVSRLIGTAVPGGLVVLALTVPTIAVTIRRLHDVGKSGAWYWIVLVPFFGGFVLLVLLAQRSESHANVYGPSPDGTANQPAAPQAAGWTELGVDADAVMAGKGIAVTAVHPDSIAEEAGIQPGDTILTVGGMPVRTPTQLSQRWELAAQSRADIDDTLDIAITRNGTSLIVYAEPTVAWRAPARQAAPQQDANWPTPQPT
jgi:uncharacterized membrane protein YhaH (DUF805 family)